MAWQSSIFSNSDRAIKVCKIHVPVTHHGSRKWVSGVQWCNPQCRLFVFQLARPQLVHQLVTIIYWTMVTINILTTGQKNGTLLIFSITLVKPCSMWILFGIDTWIKLPSQAYFIFFADSNTENQLNTLLLTRQNTTTYIICISSSYFTAKKIVF